MVNNHNLNKEKRYCNNWNHSNSMFCSAKGIKIFHFISFVKFHIITKCALPYMYVFKTRTQQLGFFQHVQYVGYLKCILQNGIVLVIQSDLYWGTWHCACVTGCTNIDQLCALHIMHAWIFTDILNLFGLFELFYCTTIYFAYRCKYRPIHVRMYLNCNADSQYVWEFPQIRFI